MNDQKQTVDIDTSRHDSSSGINPDDIDLLQAFTKRISTELHTVDHRNVGSNSSIKALQLDQKKILQGVKSSEVRSTQTSVHAPVEDSTPKQNISVSKETSSSNNTPIVAQQPVVYDHEINQRLQKIENSFKLYRKARRIKKGVSYSVSSNGFKGEIKDAELLADFVLTEVAKGVRTITIKLNDTKNKEPQ